jgi:hypothetical protein
MFPIYLHDHKITIWWSAKCGCSTIKALIFNHLLKLKLQNLHQKSYTDFDSKYLNYKNILIIRNPINRFISSYNQWFPTYCKMYKLNKNLTFEEFIDVALKARENNLEKKINVSLNHHLTNQFSEKFDDLELYIKENNINFKFDEIIKLEEFDSIEFMKNKFNITINKNIHDNKKNLNNNDFDKFIGNKNYDEIIKIKPNYKYYLNDNIINKIRKLHKKDYNELKKYNIIY